jgi:hypothetical protein
LGAAACIIYIYVMYYQICDDLMCYVFVKGSAGCITSVLCINNIFCAVCVFREQQAVLCICYLLPIYDALCTYLGSSRLYYVCFMYYQFLFAVCTLYLRSCRLYFVCVRYVLPTCDELCMCLGSSKLTCGGGWVGSMSCATVTSWTPWREEVGNQFPPTY